MAKWKNGNGPALWPIDMSLISEVDFCSIPKIDVNTMISELAIEELDINLDDTHWQMFDFKTETSINRICEHLGRRTPENIDANKGTLNTDVLRMVLSKNIINICDFKNHYVDVEYDTIFGGATITFSKYSSSPTLVIKVECTQCLVMRELDDKMTDLDEDELDKLRTLYGYFNYKVNASMLYKITVKEGNSTTEDHLTVSRPLEFICGMETLMFLEDGPEQQKLPKQGVPSLPFYLDNAKFSVVGTNGILELNGITLDLGSMEYCKANIVKAFFKRSNSNPHKKIELVDVYDAMGDNTKQWNEPGVAKTFAKTVSAARIKLNSDITKTFKLDDDKIFQQNEKQIFINPKYLSPLKKKKQKS